MANALVVVEPFGDHQRGDRITDVEAITSIMGSEHQRRVVKITVEDPPPAAPASTATEEKST